MINIDGQSYEFLGGSQLRNTQTNEIIDGNKIRFNNIEFGNGNFSGANIGGRNINITLCNFKPSKTQITYLRTVFPKIKKEIEHSIPLKDEKSKQKVLRAVTRHASCNYQFKTGYSFYRIGQGFSGIFGKSDFQAARKVMLAEMDKHAAHQFLKDSVNKYKAGKASCKNV